jgi:Protein of unknown function (DUF1573)
MKNLFFILTLVLISCKEDASSKLDPNSTSVDINEYNPKTAEQKVQESVAENQALPNVPAPVSPDATTVSFNKKEHNFGTINEGKTVTTNFKITNTGNKDLIIQNATASCGCTVPDYPKYPIKPGKSGEIKVSFDSAGKPGQQQKTVTVTANIPNGSEILTIKTNVTPKKQEQNYTITTTPATPETVSTPETPKTEKQE